MVGHARSLIFRRWLVFRLFSYFRIMLIPDAKLVEICNCSCHSPNSDMVHCAPCCWTCPECNQKIQFSESIFPGYNQVHDCRSKND